MLAKRVKKIAENLVSKKQKPVHKEITEREPSWSMSLRQDCKNNKVESFIPIGNKLSGLYIREIINPERYSRNKSCEALEVIGSSKLPLEITALRYIKNIQNSQIKTDDPQEKSEILAENYDFNTKFLKMF